MRTLPALALTAAVLVVAAACGNSSEDAQPSPTSPPTTSVEASANVKPTEAPTIAAGAPVATANESISFSAPDGVALKGHLYKNPGPNRRALVIASTLPQQTWQKHVDGFAAEGIAVLTYDVRGVGETSGAADPSKLATDLEIAVRLLRSREYPLIYVLGVGDGGAAAIEVAARQELAGVATFAAGEGAVANVGRVTEKKLFLAPEQDSAAMAAVQALMSAASAPKQSETISGVQATDPLATAGVGDRLLQFILN